jgi:hypothetical protein
VERAVFERVAVGAVLPGLMAAGFACGGCCAGSWRSARSLPHPTPDSATAAASRHNIFRAGKIVRGLSVGLDKASGRHYLVLEYVDGPSALALLQQYGKLSVGDGVHIALDVARALEHAHSRNVVHRDIRSRPDRRHAPAASEQALADVYDTLDRMLQAALTAPPCPVMVAKSRQGKKARPGLREAG